MTDASGELSSAADGLRSLSPDAGAGGLGGDDAGVEQKGAPKKGRNSGPSYFIIDSKSVKTAAEGPERGFHSGKKVKGRSPQMAVDMQGLIWAVHVHAANKADTVEGCVLADRAMISVPSVEAWRGDAGYRKTFVRYMRREWGLPVHIIRRIKKGFTVLRLRWIVERTFARGGGQRRLSKDYEKSVPVSEAMIHLLAAARRLRTRAV